MLKNAILNSKTLTADDFAEINVGTRFKATLSSFRFTKDGYAVATVNIDGETTSAFIGSGQSIGDLLQVKNTEIVAVYQGIREYNGVNYPSLAVEF